MRNLPGFAEGWISVQDEAAQLAADLLDLMVVVAYGLILPQVVLDIPRLGCINSHASLLPRWRGAAPKTSTASCLPRYGKKSWPCARPPTTSACSLAKTCLSPLVQSH